MNDATGRNTARRRRADTIARCGRIMETARRLPLTRDVLAEAIERATPVQLDLMESCVLSSWSRPFRRFF